MTAPGVINALVVAWCLLLVTGYFVLCWFAVRAGRRELQTEPRRAYGAAQLAASPSQPPVTVAVPAHNEEATIALAVRSLLDQHWHELEVIVVCNGCRDDTLGTLVRAYELEPAADSFTRTVGSLAQVRSAWTSRVDRRLRVIDIGVGGKADALNCALERSSGTVFCTVDADSLLAPDAVSRVVLPFVELGSDVVAVGSVVRVLNGASVVDGRVRRAGMPATWRGRMQVVEYARGFQLGRSGWSELGALPIISGAFGAFRTSALRVVGGFRVDTVGEDMEVVLRMHDRFRPRVGAQSVVFVPRPLCWTEVPEDAVDLRAQRMRWQQGLVEATVAHRRQVLEASTTVGRTALPFLAVFELVAPIIELVGVVAIVAAALLGLLGVGAAAALLALAASIGVLLGALGLLLEQSIGGQLVAHPRDAVVLIVAAALEQFGPRQQVAWWRLRALLTLGRRSTPSWDGMHHRGAGSVASVVDGRAVR